MPIPLPILRDNEEIELFSHDQHWRTSWHPPATAPQGRPHGAAGICVTAEGEIVLVSEDGQSWDFPAGRPEAGEDWEQVLRREMMEEACAVVTKAKLLGYSRGQCIGGSELGLVLVRSIWRADVQLLPWSRQFEIKHRRCVPAAEAIALVPPHSERVWRRAFFEAGL